ncbi:MAG: nucleotidyltransferase family protein [Prevotella sp.]|nr:nucleotidyltransferase family protein [Prevotella sp.]
MTGIEQKLLVLLGEALWGVSSDIIISPKDAGRLIRLADKQAVAGLIIDLLIRKDVRMEQQTLFDAIGYLERIKHENEQMNREVAMFARLMAETGTDYLVVKGQTLAALYPNPNIRMPGDIDFLIYDYLYVSNILKKNWGVELPHQMVEKEFAFTHSKALYELHSYLIDFGSNKHKRYWEKKLSESISSVINIGGEDVKIMEPTLYAAYIFIHLFFHFVKEGLGLRHLCDWAIMMHHYKDEIDKVLLAEALSKLGLLKAFCAFGTILVDKLGMKDFPLTLTEKDRKLQPQIMEDIMRSGNFGRDKRKVKKVGLRFKIETMAFILKNCVRYFSLAPKEMLLIPYRRMAVNLKLFTY